MRKLLATAAVVALIGATSYADLQNVEIGGGIQIRSQTYDSLGAAAGIYGGVPYNHSESNVSDQYTEQRTRINISADFSDEVNSFIELDNYSNWGQGFRDFPGENGPLVDPDADPWENDDSGNVNLYQAYIHLGQAFGSNFDIKIGRQEVQLGSEFLVGNNDTAGGFTGLSFDGITANYNTDSFNVSLMALKMYELDRGPAVSDGDADLNGIYASYTGLEDMVIDGYVLQVRLGQPGMDNTDILTYGVRVAGDWNALDYEAEVALQSGDDNFVNPGNEFKGMGINAEVGYTFDTDYAIRVFGGIAMFEGPSGTDNGFNRLFSDWEYSEFLGNTNITNMNIYRLGASIQATEKIGLTGVLSMFEIDETAGEDEVGNEVGLYATYAYSEDVAIEVGAATFLNGDLIEQTVGVTEDDPIYVYGEISLSF